MGEGHGEGFWSSSVPNASARAIIYRWSLAFRHIAVSIRVNPWFHDVIIVRSLVYSNVSTLNITGVSLMTPSWLIFRKARLMAALGASWIIRINGTLSPS